MRTYIRQTVLETAIVPVTCAVCGTVFGLGKRFQEARRDDHGTFYCPNGHAEVYDGPSLEEQQIARLKDDVTWERQRAERAIERAATAERRRRAEKAAKTRIKNRIARGVCPCCNRSFENLARHMAGQHPDYPTTQEEGTQA